MGSVAQIGPYDGVLPEPTRAMCDRHHILELSDQSLSYGKRQGLRKTPPLLTDNDGAPRFRLGLSYALAPRWRKSEAWRVAANRGRRLAFRRQTFVIHGQR
jgi:hypothetical protein